MMMSRRFHRLRRIVGTTLLVVLIGFPFLRIGGESAVRFDVPSLRLFLFGTTIRMEDFFIVLIALIFLTFLGLLVTVLFGRIWCGWFCPQTVLVDATSFVESARHRGRAATALAYMAGALLSAILSLSMIGYFVSPYDLLPLISTGNVGARIVLGSWAVLAVLAFLDLIALRRTFCATVCPYAKLQSVLLDDRSLLVAFDGRLEEECMQCDACLKACPVGIDIRNGPDAACIQCAECIDACTERRAKRKKPSLIGYFFGIPGKKGRGMRVSPFMSGLLAAIFLIFLISLAASRTSFEVTVFPAYGSLPKLQRDGSIVNSYVLALQNWGGAPLSLDLSVSASYGSVQATPHMIKIPISTDVVKVPLSVTLNALTRREPRPVMITLMLVSKETNNQVMKTINFMMPKNE